MSVEAFTKFLDANPEVAKKVAACQNYNEVAEIAKANGINVSGAELTKFAAEQTAELSDADLEAVAGGGAFRRTPQGDALGVAVSVVFVSACGAVMIK